MTSSNPLLRASAVKLERASRENSAPIWGQASRLLSKPELNKVEVNVGRISRVAEAGEVVFVPGKVLGTGVLDKKVLVGAFSFSAAARSKISAAGGSAMSIDQFLKKYPKGSGVKLLG